MYSNNNLMADKIDVQGLDAVIFDLGGVILNIDYQRTIDAFKQLGLENFDELYTQAQQNKVFDQFETGKLTTEEFIRYLSKELPEIKEEEIIDAWNAMLLDLPIHRIELLNELKNKSKIYLFSNTNAIHFESFRQKIERTFGDRELLEKIFIQTYYSHLVQERKPNAAAFNTVLKDHDLIPEKTLFIDDSGQHIVGAQSVGLQTYHLINEDIADIFK